MNRFKNFFNKVANNSKIFSREEIKNMSSDEFRQNEKAIDYQLENIGVPMNSELSNQSAEKQSNGLFNRKKSGLKGVPTGGASFYEGMNTGEKAQSVLYEDLIRPVVPMASNSIRNGMHDMSEARKDKNATVFNDLSNIQDKKLYSLMRNTIDIPHNTKGVVYNPHSDFSKKLSDSPELKDFIKKNYDALKNGSLETAPLNMKFPLTSIKNIADPINSADRWGSVGHVTLYKPKIDANDNFSTRVVDYYDFDKSKDINVPNNWAYGLQEKGIMKNYYSIADIYKKIKK